VLELEWLAVERVGQEHVIVVEDRERQVGGVALLGVGNHVRRRGPDRGHLEDGPDRHALPGGVELAPAGHAVDVCRHGPPGKGLELVPGERERGVDLTPGPEIPGREVRARHGTVVQDRELLRPILPWRNAAGDSGILVAVAEETLEHRKPRALTNRIVPQDGAMPVPLIRGSEGSLRYICRRGYA
jgi:hypothetical protein